jgi:CMP-N-acetylneuraminic acid synthetase
VGLHAGQAPARRAPPPVSDFIAVIPARGGSKRIQRKNLVSFEGRPLLAWTIDAALQSACFARVIVSTDDLEIAAAARDAGAEVPFLRSRHTDDHAPVSSVVLDAVHCLGLGDSRALRVAQLSAACPLRSSDDIRAAISAFDSHDAPFQLSSYRLTAGDPYWAFSLDATGRPAPLFPAYCRARSQDLPAAFMPSGATWLAHFTSLRQAATFYGPGHTFLEMPWHRAIDIDTVRDLALARVLCRMAETMEP